MSIALDVGRIVEERAGLRGAENVVTVALEVGAEAGIEIDSLAFCLEVVLSQPPFRSARALIERREGDVLRVNYFEVDDGNPDD